MYVTGRGTRGIGTVLPTVVQWGRTRPLDGVTVVATRRDGAAEVGAAAERLESLLGIRLQVEYRALEGSLNETLGDDAFDAAIVAVPDHLHFEVAATLLRRDMHVLVVKPLTPTVAEARALLELARSRGLHGAVELHKRFDPQNLYARGAIARGDLGRPAYAVVTYSQRVEVPATAFRSWAQHTNIFQYLGVHYADLLHFLTGYLPIRAMAVGTRGVLADRGVDTWDSVLATIEWRAPMSPHVFVSQLAIGWIDPNGTSAMSDQRFFVVGSRGRLDLEQKDRGVTLVTDSGGVETPNPHFSMVLDDANGRPEVQGYGPASIARFLDDAADIVANRVKASALLDIRPSFKQAMVSTAIVEAVNESLSSGGAWRSIDAAS